MYRINYKHAFQTHTHQKYPFSQYQQIPALEYPPKTAKSAYQQLVIIVK